MASSKEYVDYVLEQLSEAPDIGSRAMMGEYVIYCGGKVMGGIYDDRFLVKPVPAAMALLPDAPLQLPYEGGKEMLLVEELDDKDFLRTLAQAMYPQLSFPKKRKPKAAPGR